MSERPAAELYKPPRFAACDCLNCGGGIEFDASDFAENETRTVECPHCHKETSVFVDREKPVSKKLFISCRCRNLGCSEVLKSYAIGFTEDENRIVKCPKCGEITGIYVDRLIPKQASDFFGQTRVKARLELAIAAAKSRDYALDHILLIGSPGSGKATLANILATEMGAAFIPTSGLALTKAGELAGLLTNLEEGDVLFIDEIHRLPRIIEEYLYPAMKNFKLDIIIDQGPNARSVRLNLPRFTLIGSTTSKERLTPNLLSCFRIIENMDVYSVEELAAIARRFATATEVEIDNDATDRIARSADGTPIDVLNRLQHVRDFAHVKGNGKITLEITEAALKMLASLDEKPVASEGRDAIPSAIRREVWRRDGGKCVKCGSRKNLEYDHIIPVSLGGSNTTRNIELLCEACNHAKSDLIQ
jgi:holliday junction DNA helicase RuvB